MTADNGNRAAADGPMPGNGADTASAVADHATVYGRHLLRTEDVTKVFRGLKALRGVTLSVAQGEIVGLIGPNGSGKTTMLNVISGVLSPTTGRIFIGDTDVTRHKSNRISHEGISRTFQNIKLFGHLTVRQNIEIGAISGRPRRGVDREAEVDALLARFGLEHVAEAPANSLPYGDQRRVEIARALAPHPDFLLLDEPAAGMNEQESGQLLRIIRGVRAEYDCGVLIVDHDLHLIMNLCERIYVLAEGQLLAEGLPAQVRHNQQVIDVFLGDAIIEEM